jgi:hypothetical protein
MGFLFPSGSPAKEGLAMLVVELRPQPALAAERAPGVLPVRQAHLEDDWSNVACCSAMRPRPRPRVADREPQAAWPAPEAAPPLEQVA